MSNGLKKGVHVRLDIETHQRLERIQVAEAEALSLPVSRRKETILEDIILLGIDKFIERHELKI